MNRWVVAAAAVVVQAGLGSFYAWSVFRGPLTRLYGASVTDVNVTFFLATLVFSLVALGAGLSMRRVSPRVVGVCGGVLYGLGIFLASFSGGSLSVLYLTYGVVLGIGMGLCYVTPVVVLPRWFPERPGLAYGIAVLGFGAGPIVGAPLGVALISATGGPLSAFAVLGPAYAVLVGGGALLLKDPPGYREAEARGPAKEDDGTASPGWDFRGALKTWQWYAMWSIFFLNTTAGLAIISDARAMAASVGGASAALASAFVVIIAVADTTGRLFWPALSDRIGRSSAFLAMFLLQAASFALLPLLGANSFAAFVVLCAVVLTCYGGGYSTIAAFVDAYYGAGDVGAIYGGILVAPGIAGFGAPVLLALSVDATGSYAPALYATAALLLVGTVIALVIRPPEPRR